MNDEQRGFAIVVIVLLLLILLTGCATTQSPPPEPVIRTVEVKVPVPQPCKALDELGAEPSYPDTDDAVRGAPDLFERVKLLLQGRLLRQARLGQYKAARSSC